jgi:hypothetical protein
MQFHHPQRVALCSHPILSLVGFFEIVARGDHSILRRTSLWAPAAMLDAVFDYPNTIEG